MTWPCVNTPSAVQIKSTGCVVGPSQPIRPHRMQRLMHFASHLRMPLADFVFMRRALIGGLVLACSTAPLGVFLILGA